jgi:hypothetical protein
MFYSRHLKAKNASYCEHFNHGVYLLSCLLQTGFKLCVHIVSPDCYITCVSDFCTEYHKHNNFNLHGSSVQLNSEVETLAKSD